MARSRQMRCTFAGWSSGLPLMAAVALLSGCQADITGGNGDSGDKDPTTTGPGTTTTKPADVPEPGDWFAAVQGADCKVPGTLSRTRIRRLSTAQWSNTVAQALTVTPS